MPRVSNRSPFCNLANPAFSRRGVVIGALAGAASLHPALGLASSDLLGAINGLRRAHEVDALRRDRTAAREAVAHARRMAVNNRTLRHPDPDLIATDRPRERLRLVVGTGRSVADLLERGMTRPDVRDHLLGPFDAAAASSVTGAEGRQFGAIILIRTAACAR